MDSVFEKVQSDLRSALRSGDVLRRDTLRLLSSAFKNVIIEKRSAGSGFSDSDAYAVIRREVKRRNESALQYRSGGREDLAGKEEQEGAILSEYLPTSPDEGTVRAAVRSAIAASGISNEKEVGKVIGLVVKSLPNVSGNDVRRLVIEELTGGGK